MHHMENLPQLPHKTSVSLIVTAILPLERQKNRDAGIRVYKTRFVRAPSSIAHVIHRATHLMRQKILSLTFFQVSVPMHPVSELRDGLFQCHNKPGLHKATARAMPVRRADIPDAYFYFHA